MWFEDIAIGTERVLGSHIFTEDAIIAFGRKYDPQVFHTDAEAAKATAVGGLIASGWHIAAVWMRLAIDSRTREAAGGNPLQRAGVSPGFETMRWLRPVRPGTTLTYSSRTIEKVELKSRPALGLVKSLNEARDGDGALCMRFIGKGFVARKPPGE